MGKCSPGNKARNIKANKGVNNYHRLGALYSIWGFHGGAFSRRQFPLEKLAYLSNACNNPDGDDVKKKPLSGEMLLVL